MGSLLQYLAEASSINFTNILAISGIVFGYSTTLSSWIRLHSNTIPNNLFSTIYLKKLDEAKPTQKIIEQYELEVDTEYKIKENITLTKDSKIKQKVINKRREVLKDYHFNNNY